MAKPRQKKADFDLFQAPPSTRAPGAPEGASLDLFARPPGKGAPDRAQPAPRAPEPAPSLDLFVRPPGNVKPPGRAPEPPREPSKAPTAPEPDVELFERPPAAQKPPQPAPAAPVRPPEGTGRPRVKQPAPPPAPAAPPQAPAAPPQGEQLPETGDLRRTREFKEFLREKYEAGRADVQHPEPRLRRNRPTVKFWTAMRYEPFKKRVKEEFLRWKQEREAQRPRVQTGDRIQNFNQLRVGDIIGPGWGSKYKVTAIKPRTIKVVEVDRFGQPLNQRVTPRTLRQLLRNGYRRHPDRQRPNVSYEKIKAFADRHYAIPPRSVKNQSEYREWLKKGLVRHTQSPYLRLGDKETNHQEALERQVKQILETRNIGEDWRWKEPSAVQIGQKVHHPLQARKGDFLEHQRQRYRVLDVEDDRLKVVNINERGIPREEHTVTEGQLERGSYKRIEPVERPDVSFSKAKEFADQLGAPPRHVDSRSEYASWLETQFREKGNSPYAGLTSDEVEHEQALKKQIKKILEERGVGPDWEWAPPPVPFVGAKFENVDQMQPGLFFRDTRTGYRYKVVGTNSDGHVQGIQVDETGRPYGDLITFHKRVVKSGRFKRLQEKPRPRVLDSDAQWFIKHYLKNPGREAQDYEGYKAWAENQLRTHPSSPYVGLHEGEGFEEDIKALADRILQKRDIQPNWKWNPPPMVTFPATLDWEKHQDAIRKTALEGEHVKHPKSSGDNKDRPMGGGINGAVLRRLRGPDGKEQDFVFKDKALEQGAGRIGCKVGTLHQREQAAYALDRILGEGVITPPTVSDGSGSYQQFHEGAQGWRDNPPLRAEELEQQKDVQRLLFLDEIMGHEDRHYGNIMYAWKDPNGPKTRDNLRVISIDNGYAFANPEQKTNPRDFMTVACGDGCLPFQGRTFKRVLKKMPEELHRKIKQVKIPDLLKALKASGIKDKGSLMATAARVMALQDSPEVIGKFLEGNIHHDLARKNWRYMSAKEPAKLFRDYTNLPASAYEDLKRMVDEA